MLYKRVSSRGLSMQPLPPNLEEAMQILGDEGELAETRAEALAAAQGGVTGVPYTVIGQRYAVPGAQEPEAFQKAIARALEDRAIPTVSRA